MLWLRGLIFTLLLPAMIAVFGPMALDRTAQRAGGPWDAGWILIAFGGAVYGLCLLRFLAAGGTPAIFFTRGLRLLIGEEPGSLVSGGLYRFSRNPMYVGVLLVIFGQAIVFKSLVLASYGCLVFLIFHFTVVFVEEPHLRSTQGPSYELYCHAVPRWLGPGRKAK
jgi:protein-S-isoprenylcysteine O-methyltransferase Ste14